ncbi:MAG: aldo/keto reductase [Brevundimonas sp.]|uniref:aldo/keto reductase n=1 Tax=Brevundimonas sp. TaxID=1871086 RepID=UPI00273379BB|nr:aldo/keto reductase [Brevundimonas sp.]MBX9615740.1 aldo/keto reductase [Caulobacteraceae bacterium]MDP3405019.1 aldo/keto reductase [Brevundimonas sp.]
MTRMTRFSDGTIVPVLGQGTWMIGDNPKTRDAEQAALARGIDLGLTLIDTAELYGDGRSERLVGEVIEGRREEVFLVSKIKPENAGEMTMMLHCEKSLERLGVERLDLYLLHWQSRHPLEEIVAGFEELVDEGMIARWGVSNLDIRTLARLEQIEGGENCATDQVLYNLGSRGIEFDLLPWAEDRSMPLMAYSPLGRGDLLNHPALQAVADRHDATPAQIALAAVMRQPGVIAIPKASSVAHVEANAAALEIELDAEDVATLDRAFPPPATAQPLDII